MSEEDPMPADEPTPTRAIEELIAYVSRGLAVDMDGSVRANIAAARSELVAMREEVERLRARTNDLEAMLRAAFPEDDEDVPFISYGEACSGETLFWVHRNADDLDPLSLDMDANGLPILTDAARAALTPTDQDKRSA